MGRLSACAKLNIDDFKIINNPYYHQEQGMKSYRIFLISVIVSLTAIAVSGFIGIIITRGLACTHDAWCDLGAGIIYLLSAGAIGLGASILVIGGYGEEHHKNHPYLLATTITPFFVLAMIGDATWFFNPNASFGEMLIGSILILVGVFAGALTLSIMARRLEFFGEKEMQKVIASQPVTPPSAANKTADYESMPAAQPLPDQPETARAHTPASNAGTYDNHSADQSDPNPPAAPGSSA